MAPVRYLSAPDVKAKLGIPDEFSAMAAIIVGVTSGEPPLMTRKEPNAHV